jgi:hypothetical protein
MVLHEMKMEVSRDLKSYALVNIGGFFGGAYCPYL